MCSLRFCNIFSTNLTCLHLTIFFIVICNFIEFVWTSVSVLNKLLQKVEKFDFETDGAENSELFCTKLDCQMPSHVVISLSEKILPTCCFIFVAYYLHRFSFVWYALSFIPFFKEANIVQAKKQFANLIGICFLEHILSEVWAEFLKNSAATFHIRKICFYLAVCSNQKFLS